ncbi:MAG: hypothetical protein PVH30_08820 [Desulfobacterales bacterium]|jgi:hypothetical protein
MTETKPQKNDGTWLKVFCPDARCLTDEEIVAIPKTTREKAESGNDKGLWMEVFCPDEACLRSEEQMELPVRKASSVEKDGVWLSLFCPEEQCAIDDPTDLA